MTLHDLNVAIKKLCPQVGMVGGCYILLNGLYEYDQETVQKCVASCGGDLREAEYTLNRCFIVNDRLCEFLDPQELTIDELIRAASDLMMIARLYADLLRVELARNFPCQRFDVEICGDHSAEHEPLELYVTFSRSSDRAT